MKIYTKTGDAGSTSLLFGSRVSKADLRIEAYGTVDELNANIGLLIDSIDNLESVRLLKEIQSDLFNIGSNLAAENSDHKLVKISEKEINKIEAEIDEISAQLPELKHFILPGGHTLVSLSHICRTVCRRAERCVVRLATETEIDQKIIVYLNRLSDYLFVFSRYIGNINNAPEIKWISE